MHRLSNHKDANVMLKDEIHESVLRLKAAKFGHSIEEIAPNYVNQFYLPDKSDFKTTYLFEDKLQSAQKKSVGAFAPEAVKVIGNKAS